MENRRVKKIESVFMTVPTICCSCGKEIENEQMWEVSYINYFDNRIDPYYTCHNCMPAKKDVIEAFGANHLNNDIQDEAFTQNDFLSLFIVVLRIKEYTTFNHDILNQFIKIKLENNEYNRILSSYNSKDFFIALKNQIENGNVNTTIKDGKIKIHINSKLRIVKQLEKRLDYLEEVMNFVEKYKMFEKLENRNQIYQETIKRKNKK